MDQVVDTMAPTEVFKTFIRATEVWVLDPDSGRLVLGSGIYGEMTAFADVSGKESFAIGEGLPGKAWAEARPVVLSGFRGSYFKRTEAAEAAGLTAGVAFPVLVEGTPVAVVVLLLGDDAEHVGAVEVWRNAPDGTAEMVLSDGYFGSASHFEWISRHTSFPKGSGLPGLVWAKGTAMLLKDLGPSHRFIRSDGATRAGMTAGLGLPVRIGADEAWVLTMLSALGTPVARRFEIWERGSGSGFVLVDSTPKDAGHRIPIVLAGQGYLGGVIQTGMPVAVSGIGGDGASPAEVAAVAAGCTALVAVPIYQGAVVAQIAVWYF